MEQRRVGVRPVDSGRDRPYGSAERGSIRDFPDHLVFSHPGFSAFVLVEPFRCRFEVRSLHACYVLMLTGIL
ncbi:hypothetical protein H351_21685 [Rhodococcus erythropolis R138]|nr:hypothetical protein H351_21685 [Rhodococcus erythropolis R138]